MSEREKKGTFFSEILKQIVRELWKVLCKILIKSFLNYFRRGGVFQLTKVSLKSLKDMRRRHGDLHS